MVRGLFAGRANPPPTGPDHPAGLPAVRVELTAVLDLGWAKMGPLDSVAEALASPERALRRLAAALSVGSGPPAVTGHMQDKARAARGPGPRGYVAREPGKGLGCHAKLASVRGCISRCALG